MAIALSDRAGRWIAIACLLLPAPASLAAQCDRRIESVGLSIQWFDPQHKLNITEASDEAVQMYRALEAVDSVLPILRSACARQADGIGMMSYPSLSADTAGVVDDSVRWRAALVDSVRMLCFDVAPYFGAQRGGVGDSPPVPAKEALTAPLEQCGGEALLPTPHRGGLALRINYYHFSGYYFISLGLADQEVDGVILRQRLATLPNVLGRFAAGLRPIDAAGSSWDTLFHRSHGQLIALGDGQQKSRTSPIKLRYQVSWGDCPAGCIYAHTWTIRVDQKKRGTEMVPSKVRIVSEEGPAVPPDPASRF